MLRILLTATFVAFAFPLPAEEAGQSTPNEQALQEIREIRGSLILGEAIDGDAEAFSKALVKVASEDAAEEAGKEETADDKPEVCPNGGSCCENVSSKVIAKAMMARFAQQANNDSSDQAPAVLVDPPITPSISQAHIARQVHPGQPVPPPHAYWNPKPTTLPNNQNLSTQLNRMANGPHNAVSPFLGPPPHHGPLQHDNHHVVHTLRETAHELDRIAHRLEMANLCDAADEIRDAASELREEARELLEEDHDEEDDCDDDACEEDDDHDHDD